MVTATGRHVDGVTWRPALIEDEVPVPLSGADATQALQNWAGARTCTDLAASPAASLATRATETSAAPPAVAQQLSQDG
jgi:hypothetical protein